MRFKVKKKVKIILSAGLMLVSILGISFTAVCAINNAQSTESTSTNIASPDGDTPPDMNGGRFQPSDNPSERPDFPDDKTDFSGTNRMAKTTVTVREIAVLAIVSFGCFSLLFSASLFYLLMTLKNEKFYQNHDKLTIYILASCLLALSLTVGLTLLSNCILKNADSTQNPLLSSENSTKDPTELDKNNIVSGNTIDLSKEKTDVTITAGGTYTLTGSFNHSIIVDAANTDVKLILNGVEITNENTAAIIGLAAKTLTISPADGSKNKLTDGGNSEYDGCIFSNAELILEGNGTLEVNGQQNEGEGIATETQNITINSGTYKVTSNDDGINAGGDGATITINGGTIYVDASGDGIDSNKNAIINGGTLFVMGSDIGGDAGIDTDGGYTINGGLVVALGSDMIETPETSSKQKVIAFSLDEKINKDTTVALMKGSEEIVSFKATKSFKTIIISSNKITDGDYSLYTGGSHTGTLQNGLYENGTYTKGSLVTVNNATTFNVSKIINLFGASGNNRPMQR